MLENLNRLPSALELTEAMEELRALTANVVQLMARERVRLYGGELGGLTLIDWSRLRSAVASLRETSAGLRCRGGGASVGLTVGGKAISRF